jgi:hypothetical protein
MKVWPHWYLQILCKMFLSLLDIKQITVKNESIFKQYGCLELHFWTVFEWEFPITILQEAVYMITSV